MKIYGIKYGGSTLEFFQSRSSQLFYALIDGVEQPETQSTSLEKCISLARQLVRRPSSVNQHKTFTKGSLVRL